MITSLFLPERIGNYYLLSRRIVAIEITKHSVYAAIVVHKGRSSTLEAVITERYQGTGSFDEQVVHALKNLKSKLISSYEVYCIIPSSNAIFKELTLPFIGPKKIKIVIPFEVESQLPFNLAEGVVDGIITGTDTQEQKTSILVTAMKRDIISRYAGFFEDAELPLDKLSIGLIELYGLHESVSSASSSHKALVEIGLFETTIGIVTKGQLKYVRTLQKGLLAQKALHPESLADNATLDQLPMLFEEIKMTSESALQKIAPGSILDTIVLMGAVTDTQNESRVRELATHIGIGNIEFFDPKQLVRDQALISKNTTLQGIYMPSIALGLAPLKTDAFNLLQEKVQEKENQQITYQLYTIGALSLALLLTFGGYSFLKVRALKKTYSSSEHEAINELKKHFKLRSTQTQRLDIANKAAQSELHKQETAWKRISAENRYAYVTYLAELTKCISMKDSQLQLDSIILKDDTIKLYGSVPGYQQLTRLQDQLECPLFKKVPKLQAFNFKSEPITLIINPEAFNERA